MRYHLVLFDNDTDAFTLGQSETFERMDLALAEATQRLRIECPPAMVADGWIRPDGLSACGQDTDWPMQRCNLAPGHPGPHGPGEVHPVNLRPAKQRHQHRLLIELGWNAQELTDDQLQLLVNNDQLLSAIFRAGRHYEQAQQEKQFRQEREGTWTSPEPSDAEVEAYEEQQVQAHAEEAYERSQARAEAAGYDPMGLDGGDK